MEYDHRFNSVKEKTIIVDETVKEKEIQDGLSNVKDNLGERRFPTERNCNNDNRNSIVNQKRVNKQWD